MIKRRRFEIVIQKGYRKLLKQFSDDYEDEPGGLLNFDDLEQGSAMLPSAMLPASQVSTTSTASTSAFPIDVGDTDEPTTPRPAKKPLSRVPSAKYSGPDAGLKSTPNGNPFMKYRTGHTGGTPGPTGRSPSPGARKRGSGEGDVESPPRKKGKFAG